MDEVDFYLEDLKSKFRKLKNVGGYDKYYLSYSGGKDSHFLYWFIKEYSYPEFKDIKIVGINTYMEHHEIRDRIIKKYDIEVPKVYEHIERTGCMGCPYGSYKHDTEKELDLINDNQRKFVCEYFKESYEVLGIEVKE